MQRASATTDLSAITRNCGVLKRCAGNAELCVVVKADAYGHAPAGTRRMHDLIAAAVEGGATRFATAAAVEALSLREQGVSQPILTMGTVSMDELDALVSAGCDIAVWSPEAVSRASEAAKSVGGVARLHVKLDTGMGRLGAVDEDSAMVLVERILDDPAADLVGVMTHFATADEQDDSFLLEQLARFEEFAGVVKARRPEVIAHAANSAATLRLAGARLDMVRCGVAVYGLDPFGRDPADHDLSPAIEWCSVVGRIKRLMPGESTGYGRRFVAERETVIATVPVGYADGYRRLLGGRAEVLVGGTRVPVVGTVSMDNIAVDLGPDGAAEVGDEVVLIGSRDGERILAEDLARAAETINYEIATGIGGRTVRLGGGLP